MIKPTRSGYNGGSITLPDALIVIAFSRKSSGIVPCRATSSRPSGFSKRASTCLIIQKLKDPLVESTPFMVHCVDKGGELAITHYRVLRRQGIKSLLELTLETERKHRIRIHLAALGHPITSAEIRREWRFRAAAGSPAAHAS